MFLALVLFLSLCCAQPPTSIIPLSSPRLSILGTSPPRGIFDPSLLATENALFPYALSFSAVVATSNISTQLAVYDANYTAFIKIANVNAANASTFPCVNGLPCSATLIHEVSSLLADPNDPDSARAIKIFTHSYLVLPNDELHYELGFIALFTAANLSGPFVGSPLLGWHSSSPISSSVQQVLSLLPQLSDCVAFSEPGSILSTPNKILLALTCISVTQGPTPQIRVVLLSSSDHGRSFIFEGVAVQGDDASALGYSVPQLSAPDLFRVGGNIFLSITPSKQLWGSFVGYSSCIVLLLNTAENGIVRDEQGHPVVQRVLTTDAESFNGACTAAESSVLPSVGGYFLPVLTPDAPFSIVQTGILPP
jgi:hypothetical protein